MNKLTIIGNLTRDPELRATSAGVNVCNFTVAVNRRKTQEQKQNGQNADADFFEVSAWREKGELCNKFLQKGKKVCVIGAVSLRTWESDGKHGARLEVTADEVEFLSPRVSDAEQAPTEQTPPVDPESGFQQVDTDELPF